jgi:hypothetical protein
MTMFVTITAIRNGLPVTFDIEGKSKDEVFRYWQNSKMSAGCTRGALGDQPAPAATEERRSRGNGAITTVKAPKGSKIPDLEFVTTMCPECGVKTTKVKDGNYVPGQEDFEVHRRGCSRVEDQDLVIAPKE